MSHLSYHVGKNISWGGQKVDTLSATAEVIKAPRAEAVHMQETALNTRQLSVEKRTRWKWKEASVLLWWSQNILKTTMRTVPGVLTDTHFSRSTKVSLHFIGILLSNYTRKQWSAYILCRPNRSSWHGFFKCVCLFISGLKEDICKYLMCLTYVFKDGVIRVKWCKP